MTESWLCERACRSKRQTCWSDCSCQAVVELTGWETQSEHNPKSSLHFCYCVFFSFSASTPPPFFLLSVSNNPGVDLKLAQFIFSSSSHSRLNFFEFHILFSPTGSRNTRTQKARARQRLVAWWEDLPVKIFSNREWIKGDNKCFGIYGVHNIPHYHTFSSPALSLSANSLHNVVREGNVWTAVPSCGGRKKCQLWVRLNHIIKRSQKSISSFLHALEKKGIKKAPSFFTGVEPARLLVLHI